MGDSHDAGWPADDDVDWVRLYVLRPNLWYSLLKDLGRRPEPAAIARFVDNCVTSLRCLTDVHERLPEIGLTLGRFADLYEEAWKAQLVAVEHEERAVADDEDVVGWGDENRLKGGRLDAGREGWRPELHDALAPEMRAAVVNLHLRGLDNDCIACALGIPEDWPAKIVARARLRAEARAVVRAHLDGRSLGAIEKATKVPPSSALRIIRQIGEVPNGAKHRVDAAARARTIVKLRDRGLSYKEIATRVGCSMDVVKNVLRRDRRHRYAPGRSAE